MIKGVDISKWQQIVDMPRVKKEGYEFAMVRAVSGKTYDKYAYANYCMASDCGMNVGFYHYSYATDVDNIKREAALMLEFLKGKRVTMPVVLDLEDPSQRTLGKGKLNEMAKTYLNMVESAGYYVMFYSSLDWMKNIWDAEMVQRFDLWYARYKADGYKDYKCGMWQSTSKGTVPGISGSCDIDFDMRDLAKLIESKGLNHLSKAYVK